MDALVTKHSAIMDKYDPKKRVGLIVDEWGAWYDVEPGSNPGFLYQQNTLRDALVAGVTLNIFNRHCDRVKMANIAQIISGMGQSSVSATARSSSASVSTITPSAPTDVDAGFDQILFDGRHGQRQTVERGVNLVHAALFARQQRQIGVVRRAQIRRAGFKGLLNFAGIAAADVGQRGQARRRNPARAA
jgi:hypothetical protein